MKSIKELIEEKKKIVVEQSDIEKIEVIEELLIEEASFFDLDLETFCGILDFLGVPEEQMNDYYNSILSFENFKKIPNVRVIDENILERGGM